MNTVRRFYVNEVVDQVAVEEKMEQLAQIVEGVANKYRTNKWVDSDVLEQELWVNLMDLLEEYGGPLNLDANLVATSSFNKAASHYRYCRRRYEANQIYLEELHDVEEDAFDQRRFDTAYNIVLMKSVYELFPVGSRERKYAIIRLVMEGVLDEKYIDNPEDREILNDLPEKCIDSHIAWKIGYKSSSSGGMTRMKNRMKETIYEYLQTRTEENLA